MSLYNNSQQQQQQLESSLCRENIFHFGDQQQQQHQQQQGKVFNEKKKKKKDSNKTSDKGKQEGRNQNRCALKRKPSITERIKQNVPSSPFYTATETNRKAAIRFLNRKNSQSKIRIQNRRNKVRHITQSRSEPYYIQGARDIHARSRLKLNRAESDICLCDKDIIPDESIAVNTSENDDVASMSVGEFSTDTTPTHNTDIGICDDSGASIDNGITGSDKNENNNSNNNNNINNNIDGRNDTNSTFAMPNPLDRNNFLFGGHVGSEMIDYLLEERNLSTSRNIIASDTTVNIDTNDTAVNNPVSISILPHQLQTGSIKEKSIHYLSLNYGILATFIKQVWLLVMKSILHRKRIGARSRDNTIPTREELVSIFNYLSVGGDPHHDPYQLLYRLDDIYRHTLNIGPVDIEYSIYGNNMTKFNDIFQDTLRRYCAHIMGISRDFLAQNRERELKQNIILGIIIETQLELADEIQHSCSARTTSVPESTTMPHNTIECLHSSNTRDIDNINMSMSCTCVLCDMVTQHNCDSSFNSNVATSSCPLKTNSALDYEGAQYSDPVPTPYMRDDLPPLTKNMNDIIQLAIQTINVYQSVVEFVRGQEEQQQQHSRQQDTLNCSNHVSSNSSAGNNNNNTFNTPVTSSGSIFTSTSTPNFNVTTAALDVEVSGDSGSDGGRVDNTDSTETMDATL